MRGTICKTLTPKELQALSFEDAVKVHRERKPYNLGVVIHGQKRINKRAHFRKRLKSHIKENQENVKDF